MALCHHRNGNFWGFFFGVEPMSKAGNWVPLDKGLVKTLGNLGRPYSIVEAMLSHTVDVDCGKPWTINGYAKMWDWSRGKVRRFINSMRTHSGHIADRKGTQSRHPVHFIDQGLWVEADTKRTQSGHITDSKRDTTIDPNPNPNPKPKDKKKSHGEFNNVLLKENELEKLKAKFPDWQDRIEKLSLGIESKGYKYKSHYATILSWSRKDAPAIKRIDTADDTLAMLDELERRKG